VYARGVTPAAPDDDDALLAAATTSRSRGSSSAAALPMPTASSTSFTPSSGRFAAICGPYSLLGGWSIGPLSTNTRPVPGEANC